MVALEDCIALCGLSEEEVLAIAKYEHIPEISTAALSDYLLHQEHGAERIRNMLRNDIRAALARNDRDHARALSIAEAFPVEPSRGRDQARREAVAALDWGIVT